MSGIISKSLGCINRLSPADFTQRLSSSAVLLSLALCTPCGFHRCQRALWKADAFAESSLPQLHPAQGRRKSSGQRLGRRERMITQLKLSSWNIHLHLASSSFSPWCSPKAVFMCIIPMSTWLLSCGYF